ncbi:MAG: DUF1566 domain-containing protein [Candidatus Pacebacteria bacterium]|nr:DUF1566 domain-containing protein [Candidatus Paceibacterota bacterium]
MRTRQFPYYFINLIRRIHMKKYLPHILIISFVFIAIPITSATGGSKTLRSHYKSLSASQVQSMPNVSIRKKTVLGFHGHSTINHDYNPKAIKGDKVVVDNATGLMWHQSGADNTMLWDAAKEWVEDLSSEEGYAGYHDWRLPTVDEAASLLESSKKNGDLYIDPVFSKKQWNIHTGDQFLSKAGWLVFFDFGHVSGDNCYIGCYHYVRPVRSMK